MLVFILPWHLETCLFYIQWTSVCECENSDREIGRHCVKMASWMARCCIMARQTGCGHLVSCIRETILHCVNSYSNLWRLCYMLSHILKQMIHTILCQNKRNVYYTISIWCISVLVYKLQTISS